MIKPYTVLPSKIHVGYYLVKTLNSSHFQLSLHLDSLWLLLSDLCLGQKEGVPDRVSSNVTPLCFLVWALMGNMTKLGNQVCWIGCEPMKVKVWVDVV